MTNKEIIKYLKTIKNNKIYISFNKDNIKELETIGYIKYKPKTPMQRAWDGQLILDGKYTDAYSYSYYQITDNGLTYLNNLNSTKINKIGIIVAVITGIVGAFIGGLWIKFLN